MKKKKIMIGIGTAVAAVAAIVGIVFAVRQTTGTAVVVVPVNELNIGYMGSDLSLSGTVTSNASQEVHLGDKQIVDQVYVKEGDTVEVGTPLLSIDMTMTSLNLEAEKLNKQALEIQKEGVQREITKLKKTKPIPSATKTSSGDTSAAAYATVKQTGFIGTPEAADTRNNQTTSEVTQMGMTSGMGADEPTATKLSSPEPSASVTPSSTVTPSPSVSETPTGTPSPSATETPTKTPMPSGTETPTPSGTAEPTETPDSTETPAPTPTPAVEAAKIIKPDTMQYKGTGTEDDPAHFLAAWNEEYQVGIGGDFLNLAKEQGKVFYIDIYEHDNIYEGRRIAALFINGTKLGTYEDNKLYVVRLSPVDGSADNEDPSDNPVDPSNPIDPENPDGGDVWDGDSGDDFWDDDMGGYDDTVDFGDGDVISPEEIIEGYTKDELNKLIDEKEKEVRSLNLDIRQSELTIQNVEKSLQDEVIKSTVKGIVKSVGDPLKGEVNGQPFVEVESTEGLYVQGNISELLLDQISVGQTIAGTSYESGVSFEAEIREISPYPSASNDYYDGNNNVSSYPFTAYISDGTTLKNYEYVGFTISEQASGMSNSIYLEKAFVRKEDGRSYVYKADENNRLTKQEVATGKTMYGSYIQIVSGLTQEDRIAFPYGKAVKEGAKTRDGSQSDLYV